MNTRKKALILLYTYLIIWLTPKTKKDNPQITYNPSYNQTSNQLFASYNNNNIYIIKIDDLESIPNDHKNIYITDYRNSSNPVIAINNSYQITYIEDIIYILNIINNYEYKYPSNWNRTTKSMLNEWLIHNICYYLNIEKNRTKNVDFDNEEEEIYSNYYNIIDEIKNTCKTGTKTKKLDN